MTNEGVATVNLGIYQDGTILEEACRLMQALRGVIGKRTFQFTLLTRLIPLKKFHIEIAIIFGGVI